MREIRTYGSEGGGAGKPALPTPLGKEAKSGRDARAPGEEAKSRRDARAPGEETKSGRDARAPCALERTRSGG